MLKELEKRTKDVSIRANSTLVRLTPTLNNSPVGSPEYDKTKAILQRQASIEGVSADVKARIQALIDSKEGADGDLRRGGDQLTPTGVVTRGVVGDPEDEDLCAPVASELCGRAVVPVHRGRAGGRGRGRRLPAKP